MNKSLMPKINAFEFIPPNKWRFLNNAEVEQAAQRAAEFVERQFYLDNLEHRIEEYLRQWILAQLTQVYGYPENWLWLTNASKRNANVVIKDETNRSVALVAARFFGDSDLEFEQAGHNLQSDLEEIGTVRFGIVTDGRRIAFICKNGDEQIGDYKTITDFPEYNELKTYLETNQLPNLPATTQKFQKLPGAKPPVKLAAATLNDQPKKSKPFSLWAPQFKINGFDGRTIAVVAGAVLLILLGAWYITKSEPIASGQTRENAVTESEKNDKASLKITAPSISTDKPATSNATGSSPRSTRSSQSSSRQSASREIELDGSIKLNRDDISVMQSRPTMIAPSARNSQSNSAPVTPTAVVQPNNRKIIHQPYSQSN